MVVIKLDQINSNGKYKSVIGKNKGELFLCVQLNHDDDYPCYRVKVKLNIIKK